jgi:Flp pilus assembly protein TadG
MCERSNRLTGFKAVLSPRVERARRVIARFQKNNEGVVAIEFALLALPFLVLLFAILELSVIFFINAALDHAASQASRQIRTGQMQESFSSPGAQLAEFRRIICDNMDAFEGCDKRLSVTLVTSDGTFDPGQLSPATYDPSTDDVPPDAFDCSAPRQIVLVRVQYYHDLVMPGDLTRLSTDPNGANRHVLQTTTVFRNEPFPSYTGSSCGSV